MFQHFLELFGDGLDLGFVGHSFLLLLLNLLGLDLVQAEVLLIDILLLLVVDFIGLFLLLVNLRIFALRVFVEMLFLFAPGEWVVVVVHLLRTRLIHEFVLTRHSALKVIMFLNDECEGVKGACERDQGTQFSRPFCYCLCD